MKRGKTIIVTMSVLMQFLRCTNPMSIDQNIFSDYEPYQWNIADPVKCGMDPKQLEIAFNRAADMNFVHSLLVIKEGFLVGERYYRGYKKEEPHIVRSVSKSFLSAMVGIALREGFIGNLNEKAVTYLTDYESQIKDERIKDITVKHLLEMKSGVKGDREIYSKIFNSDDWIKEILSEQLASNPGDKYIYSTAATHLLNVVITRAIEMNAVEFINKYLLEPMNIEIGSWEQDPQGYYFGGNNMYFAPRDMARLGYLFLKKGMIDGEQVIPEAWIEASLTDYRNESDIYWGDLKNIGYGYLWWLGELGGYKTFLAIGHGGQFMINFPEIDMIVVTTADAYLDWDEADEDERAILSLVTKYILPAVINTPG